MFQIILPCKKVREKKAKQSVPFLLFNLGSFLTHMFEDTQGKDEDILQESESQDWNLKLALPQLSIYYWHCNLDMKI